MRLWTSALALLQASINRRHKATPVAAEMAIRNKGTHNRDVRPKGDAKRRGGYKLGEYIARRAVE